MTTLVRITIAFLLTILLSSCMFDLGFGPGIKGNGNVVRDERPISSDFTEISSSEGINVYVTQANDFHIEVEADENVIDLIGTDINNGKLKVHAIQNIGWATKNVYVSLPKVTNLASSSGSNLKGEGLITASQLDLEASSGSNLQVEVDTDNLSADSSSGANLEISGKADSFYADASSGSNIRAKDLEAVKCNADASSGAFVGLHVLETLTADASSGANISYKGHPHVSKTKSVSGSINQE